MMPCPRCAPHFDGICQGQCLPSEDVMLNQLSRRLRPDVIEKLRTEDITLIVGVYDRVMEQLRNKETNPEP
ncbi:hypothetical protein AB4254_08995 [Vibrio breoganii]